jgi:hypothetical protein
VRRQARPHHRTPLALDQPRGRALRRRGRRGPAVEQVALRRVGGARRLDGEREPHHAVGEPAPVARGVAPLGAHALERRAHEAAPHRRVGGVARAAHGAHHPAAAGEHEGEREGARRLAARRQGVAHARHQAAGREHQRRRVAQLELGPVERRRRPLARGVPEDHAAVLAPRERPEGAPRRPQPRLDRRARQGGERATGDHPRVGERGGRPPRAARATRARATRARATRRRVVHGRA